ncbi:hypothetical protein Asppvi_007424 [Aspergillus pseudoviridinutans]|uniref:Cytochrome P450 n=1 Tax=Aspergillus pseudoviridinutans TaxID=1517512 RepID=A0A9P3BFR1_9EURO|nr:uncharacterized protein Asppvi_007424 [Aspergillus pseudoviridinutans]GIJ88500.1 hypothetical protein Asppvi_007424 [Aspergillus pseudoviridinutans]
MGLQALWHRLPVNSHLVGWLVAGIVAVIAFHPSRTWWRLRHIPGPFPASITNLYRMSWVDFYVTLRPYTRSGGALHAVFNTTEEHILKQIKTPIAPLFSISSTTTFEPLVDEVLQCIRAKFEEKFTETQRIIDMGQWLQFFAFDVMGTMTFSKRYGFLDEGKDVGGMLSTIVDFMRTSAVMTQSPFLDMLLRKNIIADIFWQAVRPTPSLSILSFVAQAIKEMKEKLARGDNNPPSGHTDFLTRYIQLQKDNPDILAWAPTAWTFSNVIAGSDSVGTIMRTLLFHLLVYPHTLEKLHKELEDAKLSRPFPRYSEVRDLPYLDVCVQEAARIHRPFALPFERVVPKGGLTVLGHYLPEGTVIGGGPYVVNRDRNTFGEDAEFWRPERWLEGDISHKRKLEGSILTFGAGRRMRVVDKEKFEVENSWFFFQRAFYAQIQKRPEVQ